MVSWWNNRYGKESICGISRCRLRSGVNKNGISYTIKLPCGHCFYRTMIIEWVKKNNNIFRFPTCPICRNEFDIILN